MKSGATGRIRTLRHWKFIVTRDGLLGPEPSRRHGVERQHEQFIPEGVGPGCPRRTGPVPGRRRPRRRCAARWTGACGGRASSVEAAPGRQHPRSPRSAPRAAAMRVRGNQRLVEAVVSALQLGPHAPSRGEDAASAREVTIAQVFSPQPACHRPPRGRTALRR